MSFKSILIVEDDEDIRSSFALALEGEGFVGRAHTETHGPRRTLQSRAEVLRKYCGAT